MTTQVYEAIYHDGAFRPVRPVSSSITEGQHVRLFVELEERTDVLNLASNVYEGLTDEEIKEVEKIALTRSDIFGKDA